MWQEHKGVVGAQWHSRSARVQLERKGAVCGTPLLKSVKSAARFCPWNVFFVHNPASEGRGAARLWVQNAVFVQHYFQRHKVSGYRSAHFSRNCYGHPNGRPSQQVTAGAQGHSWSTMAWPGCKGAAWYVPTEVRQICCTFLPLEHVFCAQPSIGRSGCCTVMDVERRFCAALFTRGLCSLLTPVSRLCRAKRVNAVPGLDSDKQDRIHNAAKQVPWGGWTCSRSK